jgi:hypothetical protein
MGLWVGPAFLPHFSRLEVFWDRHRATDRGDTVATRPANKKAAPRAAF